MPAAAVEGGTNCVKPPAACARGRTQGTTADRRHESHIIRRLADRLTICGSNRLSTHMRRAPGSNGLTQQADMCAGGPGGRRGLTRRGAHACIRAVVLCCRTPTSQCAASAASSSSHSSSGRRGPRQAELVKVVKCGATDTLSCCGASRTVVSYTANPI